LADVKIKKYEAQTEQQALETVRNELGADAIVLNVKKTQPKGILGLFRKPVVEVTAAYEERNIGKKKLPETQVLPSPEDKAKDAELSLSPEALAALKENAGETPKKLAETGSIFDDALRKAIINNDPVPSKPKVKPKNVDEFEIKDISVSEQAVKIRELEAQLQSSELALSRMSRQLVVSMQKAKLGKRKYKTSIVQMFYDTLTENGVLPEICEEILDEIDDLSDIDEIDLNLIVKIIYNTIVHMLSGNRPPEPEHIDKDVSKTAVYAFIGPTGVGKTTTIAKLAAEYMLNRGLNVGLITSDTYRIAAVQQLGLYGEILQVDVAVVYNNEELPEHVAKLSEINDVILVDTAGRSHKNEEAVSDLDTLLKTCECNIFLVLSLTTKYEDIIAIIETYSDITDFSIIFTKWDETSQVGSILNVARKVGKNIAYITNGQSVPSDFEILVPEKVACALLGL
jgi:flagellar biosynthesis protein FlhF